MQTAFPKEKVFVRAIMPAHMYLHMGFSQYAGEGLRGELAPPHRAPEMILIFTPGNAAAKILGAAAHRFQSAPTGGVNPVNSRVATVCIFGVHQAAAARAYPARRYGKLSRRRGRAKGTPPCGVSPDRFVYFVGASRRLIFRVAVEILSKVVDGVKEAA